MMLSTGSLQMSAVQAAETMAREQRAGVMVLAAFNSGSPIHAALLKESSSCLGRGPEWVMISADHTDSDAGAVDTIVGLRSSTVAAAACALAWSLRPSQAAHQLLRWQAPHS